MDERTWLLGPGPPADYSSFIGSQSHRSSDSGREEGDAQSGGGVLFSRQEVGAQVGRLCSRYVHRCCSLKTLKRRLPVLTWLPRYSLSDLEGDAVAGVTVALTVIPQGLALAQLAGLPAQYGLYTAFMGCFMYMLFGSCKDLTIGPTAIMSLMTAEHVHLGGAVHGPVYAILLTFFSGLIQLAMGFLNLGFLVNFISGPVISGFTSAAAITIAVTQLKGLFGLHYEAEGFIPTLIKFFENLKHTNYYDMAMGLSSVLILLLIRQFKDKKFAENSRLPVWLKRVLEKFWFMFATGRNAIVVLVCAGIAAILINNKIEVLSLTKGVSGGLPPFKLPEFSYPFYNNATNHTETKYLFTIVKEIGSGMIIIPLLSILEAIAIAKAFAKGKKLDATQELIALGVCNLMGSFVSAYPTTGSFSRTAINNNSGVKTPLSGLFTGCIVLMALGFLARFFQYLPNSSLSAIIFVSVIFMVHYQDVPLIWRTKKWDLVPLFFTFFGSFIFGLEFGILMGVGCSFLFLIFQQARPSVELTLKTTNDGVTYLHVRPDRSIYFPSIEFAKTKINKALPDEISNFCVVFDGSEITSADYTMALGIKNMVDSYKKDNITTIFTNLQPNVRDSIEGTKPAIFLCCRTEEELHEIINNASSRKSTLRNGMVKIDLPSDVSTPIEPPSNGFHSNGDIATSNVPNLVNGVHPTASPLLNGAPHSGDRTPNGVHPTASPLLNGAPHSGDPVPNGVHPTASPLLNGAPHSGDTAPNC